MYLKQLRLKNYCNFSDETFFFTKDDGTPYKFICLFGPNGIGKCVTGDTFIIESGRMRRIHELFDHVGYCLEAGRWYSSEGDVSVETSKGQRRVPRIYYNGKSQAVKIATSFGYELCGSYDRHQVLAVRGDSLVFTKLSELEEGDHVCISRGGEFPSRCEVTAEEAELMGLLIAEGSHYGSSFRFHNSEFDVIERFRELFSIVFSCDKPSAYGGAASRCYYVNVCGEKARHLIRLGLSTKTSAFKCVPDSILCGTEEVYRSFLRGYFEGDGGIEAGSPGVSCCSISKDLLSQVQLMLLRLGIISALKKKRGPEELSQNDHDYISWRLFIQGEDLVSYSSLVGFISSRKSDSLDLMKTSMLLSDRNPNVDVVPISLFRGIADRIRNHIMQRSLRFTRSDYKNTRNGLHCLQESYIKSLKCGISWEKLNACCATVGLDPNVVCAGWYGKYFMDTIKEISITQEEMFDINVDEVHDFWSNGLISHNSTFLEALTLLTSNFYGRDEHSIRAMLEKHVMNPDYVPTYQKKPELGSATQMLIEGVFVHEDREYVIALTEAGHIRNDFMPIPPSDASPDEANKISSGGPWGNYGLRYLQRMVHMVSADSGTSMGRFQVHTSRKADLEKIVSEITRFPTKCQLEHGTTPKEREFSTDLVITKTSRYGEKYNIHFKRMSAGERKITKSFSELLNLMNTLANPNNPDEVKMPGWPPIILMDNLVMHVYYDRHVTMVDCIKDVFADQQIFATTHSGILISRHLEGKNDTENEMWINLEDINL